MNPMRFFLLLGAAGCADQSFSMAPAGEEIQTQVYLVRETGRAPRTAVREPNGPALELEDPEEVILFQYSAPQTEVEAWLTGGGLERCQLLTRVAHRLRLSDPIGFVPFEPRDDEFERLFPEWDELCVNCRPFRARSVLYDGPDSEPDEIRTGGGHAPLPSGAFLAAGRPEDGYFRVTETQATRISGPTAQKVTPIVRLADGHYAAAEGASLRSIEVDAEETTAAVTSTLTLPDVSVPNAIRDMVLAPGDSPSEVLVVDAYLKVLRSDRQSWEEVVQLPNPANETIDLATLVWLARDHFFLAVDRPEVLEWKDGRVLMRDVGRGNATAIAFVPGFGLLAGTDQGEVLVLQEGAPRSLAVGQIADDTRALRPYRNGFILVSKGGFIEQFAPHLGRFCDELSTIPGAQNSPLRGFTAVPAGFFCSDCLQSRSGGEYGATWLEQQ